MSVGEWVTLVGMAVIYGGYITCVVRRVFRAVDNATGELGKGLEA